MEDETFSTWFTRMFKDSRLSAKEFADRAQVSKPLVYFYLWGTRLPTETTMSRIAAVFNTTLTPEQFGAFTRKGLGRPYKTI